jgi:ferredoxin
MIPKERTVILMIKRKIIEIDEKKCDGCRLCIPDCPEGALQIIDGKARLVSDLFCDGLGACIGSCPRGAIKIVERKAEPYDEEKVMERIVKQGDNVIKAHLEHLKAHGEESYLKEAVDFLEKNGIENPMKAKDVKKNLPCGCPGSSVMDFRENKSADAGNSKSDAGAKQRSELRQWPVQLMLVPPNAPYFNDADLLVAADCVPFANANFHQDLLKGKVMVMGCPKLDDAEHYEEKLSEIIKSNNIKSITLVHMEVPCCFGLEHIVENALKASGKKLTVKKNIISIDGDIK